MLRPLVGIASKTSPSLPARCASPVNAVLNFVPFVFHVLLLVSDVSTHLIFELSVFTLRWWAYRKCELAFMCH